MHYGLFSPPLWTDMPEARLVVEAARRKPELALGRLCLSDLVDEVEPPTHFLMWGETRRKITAPLRLTRASVQKRRRHAKRPSGRT